MTVKRWQLQEAKNKFSEVAEAAVAAPQVVTKHGRDAVVIVGADDYFRMMRPHDSLADFLLSSPLAASELTVERDRRPDRKVSL